MSDNSVTYITFKEIKIMKNLDIMLKMAAKQLDANGFIDNLKLGGNGHKLTIGKIVMDASGGLMPGEFIFNLKEFFKKDTPNSVKSRLTCDWDVTLRITDLKYTYKLETIEFENMEFSSVASLFELVTEFLKEDEAVEETEEQPEEVVAPAARKIAAAEEEDKIKESFNALPSSVMKQALEKIEMEYRESHEEELERLTERVNFLKERGVKLEEANDDEFI